MSSPQPPDSDRPSTSSNLFEIISACQILVIAAAVLWGIYQLWILGNGGYMGFGIMIVIGVYLPSLLLLIPTWLLIQRKRRLSSLARVASYCYYGISFAWGLFLLRLPFL